MPLRFLTAGESHGPALVGIIEGVPAGLALSVAAMQPEMARRKRGAGRGQRQHIETDALQILGGVRFGVTLGSPIAIVIENLDFASWQHTMQVAPLAADAPPVDRLVEVPRPGHADWVGGVKYGHQDLRNVLERSSARETAMRVALGTVARTLLAEFGVHVASRVVAIGDQQDDSACSTEARVLNAQTDASPVRALEPMAGQRMVDAIAAAAAAGHTLGGVFEVVADGLPIGLGSYAQWDRRLEAALGQALLSLNAIKGVEVGIGFRAARLMGHEVHDSLTAPAAGKDLRYASNRAGGIEGGMSNGQPLWVRCAMKPLATAMIPLPSVHIGSRSAALAHVERSDVCAVPSAAVVAESLVALVLANAMLEKFGGDSLTECRTRIEHWREQAATNAP